MRKKCVRWTKSVRPTLIVAIALVSALAQNTGAQSSDPSTLPRLTFENLEYLGGFRLPRGAANGDTFAMSGGVAAFSPVTNTLFVSSRASRVAEVTIPRPVLTGNVNEMPFASYLQPFVDPMEGHLSHVGSGVALAGLMVYGDRLYGTASVYYDASNSQRLSHFAHSLQLNQPSFSGWSQVWETGKAGFVAGFMAPVPVEWRSRLGGPAATGQCCIPVVSRTSWGPSALAFDPAKVGQQAVVPASPMVYYTGGYPSLGPWSGANPVYGATTMMGGMAIIGGTRTALFIGRNGMGPYCYGNGTGHANLAGTASPDGSHYCYDPTSSDKGTHAYPYRFQIWAYDVNDLAAVKAGAKQPWDVLPYGVWPFDLPTIEGRTRIGGVAYDAERQLLYITQLYADKDGYESRPIVHAFQLDLPPAPVPVSAVTVSANLTSPQVTDTAITFSAVPTDGVPPYQFKWAVADDGETSAHAESWSASNTFTWTPAVAHAGVHVRVWARSAWNHEDEGEASNAMPFAINAPPPAAPPPPPPPPAGKVTAVTIAAGQPSPVLTGTATTWTAAAEGGAGPLQYKWMVHNGANWIVYKHWSTETTFTYTPGLAGTNKISVGVRSAGNTKDEAEAYVASASFTVAGPSMVTPFPPPQTSAKVLAVFIAPDKAAPQATGTTVTWSATPVGGTAAPLYKWFVYNGSSWVAQGGWTSSPAFAWTPAPNAKYRIAVWAKHPTNPADAAEASTTFDYLITGVTP